MKKQRIRVKLKSYDHRQLDKAVKAICLTAKRTGADLVGPIPLKSEVERVTVLRSPHVDKESREQFQLNTHKRLMYIISPSDKTMDALMKLNISSSVYVMLKLYNE